VLATTSEEEEEDEEEEEEEEGKVDDSERYLRKSWSWSPLLDEDDDDGIGAIACSPSTGFSSDLLRFLCLEALPRE
jgi:hypothetical protein